MTYAEAVDYLHIASGRGSRLGLERVTELCRLLGDPQEKLRVIHVAGTNGKGSFGAMLSAILDKSGIRTGWFSSPALTGYTDHFRIGGECISEERFGVLIGEVSALAETMEDKPTEFEVIAAAAYLLFLQEHCDICIIECGMGGDTDATNVISSPLLSVITNVQLDHSGFIGNTIAEIAGHKAGIIKAGRPVLFGGSDPEALEVISAAALEKGAPLYRPDSKKLRLESANIYGSCYVWDTGDGTVCLRTKLVGAYQYENILNVMAVVELLRLGGISVSYEKAVQALSDVSWHGRFELLRRKPVVMFDGAHNPDGMRSAAETIKRCFPSGKTVIVLGVMADKDYRLYAEMLEDVAEAVLTVAPDNPRALPAEELAEVLSSAGITAAPCKSVDEAVQRALAIADATGRDVVALGSLYMYREFTEALDRHLPAQEYDPWL